MTKRTGKGRGTQAGNAAAGGERGWHPRNHKLGGCRYAGILAG